MRRHDETKWWLLGLVAVVAWTGCVAEPHDGGDELDRLAHELFEAHAIANGRACGDCFEELAPASQQACDELALHEEQCWIDAYRIDASASERHLDCALPAEQDYAVCLEQDVVCGDPSTWEECAYAAQSELDDCDPLPDDVRTAISRCSDPD